ncbi:hypothetical protein DICVIV_05212 [Dictyocaulus viviparus]|uniref:Uncharacterized protein n=1 Tax=Dictyocaulus viviparus TaxID=29172 RepID=A0A0D8XVI3_DICVI|nr:hypothetical protein DICVIV_05212 [Dictyocaulus viviparus]
MYPLQSSSLQVYPIQLKTLLNHETNGTYFKDRIIRGMEGIKVSCLQWDSSPNHIKYRMDIDRDGLLFREVHVLFSRMGQLFKKEIIIIIF